MTSHIQLAHQSVPPAHPSTCQSEAPSADNQELSEGWPRDGGARLTCASPRTSAPRDFSPSVASANDAGSTDATCRTNDTCASLQRELDCLSRDKTRLQSDLEAIQKERDSLRLERDSLLRQHGEVVEQRRHLARQVTALRAHVADLQNELDLIDCDEEIEEAARAYARRAPGLAPANPSSPETKLSAPPAVNPSPRPASSEEEIPKDGFERTAKDEASKHRSLAVETVFGPYSYN